jgi:hypothetical protein
VRQAIQLMSVSAGLALIMACALAVVISWKAFAKFGSALL